MSAYHSDSMTVFITCYLSGLTDKLKIYNDSEPKCAQTHGLTCIYKWIYGRLPICKHIDIVNSGRFYAAKTSFWLTPRHNNIRFHQLEHITKWHFLNMEEVNLTKNHLLLQCYHSLSWLLLKLLKCFNLEGMSMPFNLIFHFCRLHGVLGLVCVFGGHGARILLFQNEDLPVLRKIRNDHLCPHTHGE